MSIDQINRNIVPCGLIAYIYLAGHRLYPPTGIVAIKIEYLRSSIEKQSSIRVRATLRHRINVLSRDRAHSVVLNVTSLINTFRSNKKELH